MDLKQFVMLALQVSILCTVFSFGVRTRSDDLLYLVRRPSLLLRSLLAVLGIMPLLAVGLATMAALRPTVEIVLVALAISPIPPLLPKREGKAGGEQSFGLALMVMLALLSVVVIPLVLTILERVFERPLSASSGTIARLIAVGTILPLLAGMALRAMLPRFADRLETPIHLVANVLLPLAAAALLAGTWQEVWSAAGDGTVLAMVAFVAAGLLVGHVLGGPRPEHSVVLALSSACRHPAIALAIAARNYPDERFGGTILLYLIVNLVVGLPYLAWQRRQAAPGVPA